MHIETGGPALGAEASTAIVLNEHEKATLRRAYDIARRCREAANDLVGKVEFEDTTADDALEGIEHGCHTVYGWGGRIEVAHPDRP